jgi:SAM-dependent methyltransferase
MSPHLLDYPRYAWQLLRGDRSTGEKALDDRRTQDLAPYLDLAQPRRILDVANGRLRPQYSLLRSAGHQVYGIDWVNRPRRSRTDLAYVFARELYRRRLGLPGKAMRGTLTCGDVGKLPFYDGFFDLTVSAAAFEHFLDVPAVLTELYRVLRPGGMIWVSVHLFTSPTGGHNVTFAESPIRNLPAGIEAWDHLRKRQLPFSVPLNEWRRDQYLAAFADHFELLKSYCNVAEGQALLTDELRCELAGYDEEELTCAAYVIMARKPSAASLQSK